MLSGPSLSNCTLCHDWSVENGASMIRVDSNYGRTYSTLYTIWYNIIYYTDFWMGGYLRSGYHTLCGEKFLLVFTSGAEADSSMIIQVHQDTFEDNLGIWIQSYVKPWTRIIQSEEPQDRRRHIVLCVFIIVAIVWGSEGNCAKTWHILKMLFHDIIYC